MLFSPSPSTFTCHALKLPITDAYHQLIELWETFLMQMDADDDEPLNRGILAGSEQAASTAAGVGGTTDSLNKDPTQTDSHPREPDDIDHRQPEGPPATATDLALEQDA